MAGIYIIGVTAQYLQQRIMIGVSQGALEKIRNDLFVKMQHLPVRFYDTNNHGDLMSRYTNDLDAVGDMLNNTVLQIISSVITVVGTLGLIHERVADNCDGCDGSAHDESGRSSGRKEPEILSGAAGSDRYFKRLYRRNDDGTEGCKGVLP